MNKLDDKLFKLSGDFEMSLNKESMAKLFSMVNDYQRDFAIITAYRKANDKDLNTKLNVDLRHELNVHKLGVYRLVGHWKEARIEYLNYQDCPEEELIDVIHRSYLTIRHQDISPTEFKDLILFLSSPEKHDQNAVVLRIEELDINGIYDYQGNEVNRLQTNLITISALAYAYSQHVLKINMDFDFVGVEKPQCVNFGKQAFYNNGFRWI